LSARVPPARSFATVVRWVSVVVCAAAFERHGQHGASRDRAGPRDRS